MYFSFVHYLEFSYCYNRVIFEDIILERLFIYIVPGEIFENGIKTTIESFILLRLCPTTVFAHQFIKEKYIYLILWRMKLSEKLIRLR